MRNSKIVFKLKWVMLIGIAIGCTDDIPVADEYSAVKATFGDSFDLEDLPNYEAQPVPAYITKNNSGANPITNEGAILGRVLFYDVNLSKNNTISCASCHKQQLAFSDTDLASQGVNGVTGRHSMRLVNSRFSVEPKFFWDERAVNLENQTTQPIKDHIEMGFSGTQGDPDFNNLIEKLNALNYYPELFKFVYGDDQITEVRIQRALAQFVRSIQSFDSKFDIGRSQAPNDMAGFPNFTPQENQGKMLFLLIPQFDANGMRINGGAGCQGCHRAPEFDIDPNSKNNGVIGVLEGTTNDLTNTRSPSLRDLIKPDGNLLTPAMHDASLATALSIIDHYNVIEQVPGNNNLDPRLTPGGKPQQLQLTATEKDALIAFLKTLSGTNVYTDPKWSNPFVK